MLPPVARHRSIRPVTWTTEGNSTVNKVVEENDPFVVWDVPQPVADEVIASELGDKSEATRLQKSSFVDLSVSPSQNDNVTVTTIFSESYVTEVSRVLLGWARSTDQDWSLVIGRSSMPASTKVDLGNGVTAEELARQIIAGIQRQADAVNP